METATERVVDVNNQVCDSNEPLTASLDSMEKDGLLLASLSTSAKQFKSIMKNSKQKSQENGTRVTPSKASIQWDEETIAEHNKERGTRMKIEEPGTPYHHFDSNEEFIEEAVSLGGLSEGSGAAGGLSEGSGSAVSQVVQDAREGSAVERQKLSKEQAERGMVNPDELYNKLQKYAYRSPNAEVENGETVSLCRRGSGSGSRSVHLSSEFDFPDDRPRSQEELAKRKKFEDKRKAHYNEFRELQTLRLSGALDDSSDEADRKKDAKAASQ